MRKTERGVVRPRPDDHRRTYGAAGLAIRLPRHAPRKAEVRDLGIGDRAGTNEKIHPELLRDGGEAIEIARTLPVVDTFCALVDGPRDRRVDDAVAEGADRLEDARPVRGIVAPELHGTGDQAHGPAPDP